MTVEEFPLAWRWTESEPGVPAHMLASIVPLAASEAVQLNERLLAFCQHGRSLSRSLFPVVISQRTDIPAGDVRAWLLQRQPRDIPVFVSWKVDLAVRTTWQVFTDYWESFCYPSSDDVVIWPASDEWVLAFYHYEQFEFGRKHGPNTRSPQPTRDGASSYASPLECSRTRAVAQQQSPKGRGSLLIVDDQDGPRQSLRVIFKGDYNLLMAGDGPTAIDLAKQYPIDVVVLDVCMAGMSGIEVLERLKCVNPNIEAIMMTAFETTDTIRQALRLRACDYINKPFDVATMRAAVGKAMQKRDR